MNSIIAQVLEISRADPVSRDSLPLEALFRYRFSQWRIYFSIESPPGDYILKQSLRGERECFIELGYSNITFIANQSTLFCLTHSFIHSFIHTEHLYSASSRELLRGAPDSSTAKKSSLKLRKKRR